MLSSRAIRTERSRLNMRCCEQLPCITILELFAEFITPSFDANSFAVRSDFIGLANRFGPLTPVTRE
jgi:hypothetical protein